MATSTSSSDNVLSFEDFQQLLSRSYVNSAFLSQANPDLHEFYLGPSFRDADSVGQVAVAQLFPCTQDPPFLNPFPLKPIRERGIHTWPKTDATFHF